MGDEIAEEAARKKAEAKREQKKIAKKEKVEIKEERQETKDEIIAKRGEGEISTDGTIRHSGELKATPESPAEEAMLDTASMTEKQTKTSKKKHVEGKYRFAPGKKYAVSALQVDPKKLYSLAEAVNLVKKTSYSKFDGSVEVHINATDKNLRGTVTLPHSTGKTLRVKIADDALIANPVIDFDVLVASPDMMPKLAKIAKILGPKGLMPNPKTNTISENPSELVRILSSSVQWKTQPDFPIIHAVIGKVSFEAKKLEKNFAALTKSIGRDKIVSVFLKATMGPSIKTEIA